MSKKRIILLVFSCLIVFIGINGVNAVSYDDYEYYLSVSGGVTPNNVEQWVRATIAYDVGERNSISSSITREKNSLKKLEKDYKNAKKYTKEVKNVKKTTTYKNTLKKYRTNNKLTNKHYKLYNKYYSIKKNKLYYAVNKYEYDKIVKKYDKQLNKHGKLNKLYYKRAEIYKNKLNSLIWNDQYYRNVNKNYNSYKKKYNDNIRQLEVKYIPLNSKIEDLNSVWPILVEMRNYHNNMVQIKTPTGRQQFTYGSYLSHNQIKNAVDTVRFHEIYLVK